MIISGIGGDIYYPDDPAAKDALPPAPSVMSFQMPDWLGGIRSIGASAADSAAAAFSFVTDPVKKEKNYIVNSTKMLWAQIAGSTTEVAAGVAEIPGDVAKSVTTSILPNLSSGLKWGTALVIVGVALYAFLIFSPYLPKPKGAS